MMTQTDLTALSLKALKEMRRDNRDVEIGDEVQDCRRCGGNGWYPTPSHGACFECYGRKRLAYPVFDADRNKIADAADSELSRRDFERAQRKQIAAMADSDQEAVWIVAITAAWIHTQRAEARAAMGYEGHPADGMDWWSHLAYNKAEEIVEAYGSGITWASKAKPLTEKQVAAIKGTIEFINEIPAKRAAAEAKAAVSQHVGVVGVRMDIEAVVEFVKHIDGHYGTTTLLKMRDADGNLLVWFKSGYENFEKGTTLVGKGTVKSHDSYNGEAQTVLTRCKLAEKGA